MKHAVNNAVVSDVELVAYQKHRSLIATVRGSKRMRVFCCSAIYSLHNLRMRLRSSHHFVKILENRDNTVIRDEKLFATAKVFGKLLHVNTY